MIIDDEREICEMVSLCLENERYQPLIAEDGRKGLQSAREEKPDLIILDIYLPDMDGIEVCQELRNFTSVPILFLSCKSEDVDKIVGLRVGGDDYITKPFSPGELTARVKAHLRRNRLLDAISKHNQILRFPGLEIDIGSHEIRKNEAKVPLSAIEFQILTILAKNPNRVFNPDHLYELVWGNEELCDPRTVAVHISNLRKKIESDPTRPTYILTVRGVGYKFNVPSPEPEKL